MQNPQHLIQIASIQTLARRLDKYQSPDVIVWDEAHHVAAKSWASVMATYPNAIHIGLSATPERLDGTGLSAYFDEIVRGPAVADLIEHGFLSKYRLFAPSTMDTSGVHSKMGDFNIGELEHVADKPKITGDAITHYRRLCAGKRALVFCVSINHSMHVAAEFVRAGIRAEHVDSRSNSADRARVLRDYENGDFNVLCNVELFGEGLDIPGIRCAILLRPTQSRALYLQQIGRALRVCEGKEEAIILDHAGNSLRHGLPDQDYDWSLEGQKKKRGKQAEVAVRQCPNCYAVIKIQTRVCECGAALFVAKPRQIETKEGELAEVDLMSVRREARKEQGTARTLDELIAIEHSRGYKPGWAKYVFEARNRRRA